MQEFVICECGKVLDLLRCKVVPCEYCDREYIILELEDREVVRRLVKITTAKIAGKAEVTKSPGENWSVK